MKRDIVNELIDVPTYILCFFFFLWFRLWLWFWFFLSLFSSFLFCDDYTVRIQVSTIEVRYEHLNVEAEPYEHLNVETEPYARSKAVLTFSNFVVDILEFSFSKYFNCRIKIEKKVIFISISSHISTTGVPTVPVKLKLNFVVRSRAYVLGKLVKPRFYKTIDCSITLKPKKINAPINLKYSCTYDWFDSNSRFHYRITFLSLYLSQQKGDRRAQF